VIRVLQRATTGDGSRGSTKAGSSGHERGHGGRGSGRRGAALEPAAFARPAILRRSNGVMAPDDLKPPTTTGWRSFRSTVRPRDCVFQKADRPPVGQCAPTTAYVTRFRTRADTQVILANNALGKFCSRSNSASWIALHSRQQLSVLARIFTDEIWRRRPRSVEASEIRQGATITRSRRSATVLEDGRYDRRDGTGGKASCSS
jgi:hypothetical protein